MICTYNMHYGDATKSAPAEYSTTPPSIPRVFGGGVY